MKKSLVVLACILFLFTGCDNIPQPIPSESNSAIENPDFRNAKWGMSIDEVKSSENSVLILETETNLLYSNIKALGFSVDVSYKFQDGKLINGGFVFQQDHPYDILYYNDYKKVVEGYTAKYGEPTTVEEHWERSLYKDDPDKWGYAIKKGDVFFITRWEIDTTRIGVIINAKNEEFSLVVVYQPNENQKTNTNGI